MNNYSPEVLINKLIDNKDKDIVLKLEIDNFRELMRSADLINKELLIVDMQSNYFVKIKNFSRVQIMIEKNKGIIDEESFKSYKYEFINPYSQHRNFSKFIFEEIIDSKCRILIMTLVILLLSFYINMPIDIVVSIMSGMINFIAVFISILVVLGTVSRSTLSGVRSFIKGNYYYELENDRYLTILAFLTLISSILCYAFSSVEAYKSNDLSINLFTSPVPWGDKLIYIGIVVFFIVSILFSLILAFSIVNYYFVKVENELMVNAKTDFFKNHKEN